MDLNTAHLSAFCEVGRSDTTGMYSTFAAPTPINLNKTYGNTLTPGAIPSPLNFSSITPPSSPYSFYGLYSPSSASHISPLYEPSFLKRLKSNPMFKDLQTLLRQECLQMNVPANLITTSWNLMELHKSSTSANQSSSYMPPPAASGLMNQHGAAETRTNQNAPSSGQKVYMCHMKLQDKLLKVRIDPAISADGLVVENGYSTEVGKLEMERYQALHSCPDEKVKATINSYYDKQRLSLVDKTEAQLDKLIIKAEEMRQSALRTNRKMAPCNSTMEPALQKEVQNPPPEANQGASLLLAPPDDKDKINAVRKLKFNVSDEDVNVEDDEEDDYLNGSVNSEDFEIDDIDVETVDQGHNEISEEPVNKLQESCEGNRTDLLTQCIAVSGIGHLTGFSESLTKDSMVNTTASSTGGDHNISASESILPDSSTTDSPVSIQSTPPSSNQSISPDGSTTDTNSTFNKELSRGNNFQPMLNFSELFGTPANNSLKFTNPDNLSLALSEMQKLCGGPTVSFTPELRRDITHNPLTPETMQTSPFAELSSTTYNRRPKSQTNRPSTTEDQFIMPNTATSKTHPKAAPNVTVRSPTDNTMNSNASMEDSNDSSVSSASGNGKTKVGDLQFENTPVFRTHRMLNAEATNILSKWYHDHVQYPYPNDEEVAQLTKVTGISARQVKKWMANKRVRCFNTLSITGNHHPIRYKYQGKGRKRKEPMDEKENCDSTTNDRRAKYSMLTEPAKNILNQWYEDHVNNPYPTEEEKQLLAETCGITLNQVKSWFANKRNRTNNTKKQVPNYFIEKFPEYSHVVQMVGQIREEERNLKRRKVNEYMYIQPTFYL